MMKTKENHNHTALVQTNGASTFGRLLLTVLLSSSENSVALGGQGNQDESNQNYRVAEAPFCA